MEISNILALDYGTKRIGAAIGIYVESFMILPLHPIKTVSNILCWQAIDDMYQKYLPQSIVLGLPLDYYARETRLSNQTRFFADHLACRYPATPIHFQHEILTTKEAEKRIADFYNIATDSRKMKKFHPTLDSNAACIILEDYWNANMTQAVF